VATIFLDPASPLGPQIDAAQDGDVIRIPAGVLIPTKKVTFEVEALPPPPSPLVLKVIVNGVERASEPVSKGDVVSVELI
jgi:hypothetical protein